MLGSVGPLLLGMAVPMTSAIAQDQGPCAQIRAACLGAGFVQGAAREGIGLQVHCIMPIMHASAQPPTARRPLPRVDPQLVADCRARSGRFARFGPQSDAPTQPAPASPPAPGLVNPNANPPPTYGGRGQVVPDPRQGEVLRPPMPMTSERRAVLAALPPEDRPETGPAKALPPQFRRTMVDYPSKEPAGTIVVDTAHTYLYLVQGNGKAMRYGIGVGRQGFTWSGVEKVAKVAEWPDWHPPEEMIERQPYLPRFMAGGEGNPLGARALYLGQTLYRIHGTNQPSTIGTFVSSGCIRLTNDDITDLYGRVKVGTRVVVLPNAQPGSVQANTNARPTEPAPPRPRPKATTAEKPAAAAAPGSQLQPSPPPAPAAKAEAPGKDGTGAIPAPPAAPPPPAEELHE